MAPFRFCGRGIHSAVLLFAAMMPLLTPTAQAQTFYTELIPLPPGATNGATIKDISDSRSLIVERLDNRGNVYENFHYPVVRQTGTYAPPVSISFLFNITAAGGIDSLDTGLVGGSLSQAAYLQIAPAYRGRSIHPTYPMPYRDSFTHAVASSRAVGWARPEAGTRHAGLWDLSNGIFWDLHPEITRNLGADWISSELRGLQLHATWPRMVGWGERRGIPGHQAIAALGGTNNFVALHPQNYLESEAWAVYEETQVGWGRDSSWKEHALLWRGDSASVRILDPAGFVDCRAADIDEAGVVGYGKSGERSRALLWKELPTSPGNFGSMDLHNFLPSGATESKAVGLTWDGAIAGHFRLNGLWQPVVWHPIHLTGVTLETNRILAGARFRATAHISQPAPAGGVLINIGPINGPYLATGTPSVVIPAGATSVEFTVQSRPVNKEVTALVYAQLGYERQYAPIELEALSLEFVRR